MDRFRRFPRSSALLVLAFCAPAAASAIDVPAGTEIQLRLKTKVSSQTSKPKDPVEAVVISPVMSGGQFLIPAGAVVRGSVDKVVQSAKGDERSVLALSFTELDIDGATVIPLADWDLIGAIRDHSVIVNATSIGWNDEQTVLAPELLDAVDPQGLIADLTYRDTPLLVQARARGIAILDGLPMLVHQGARSFELWTGLDAPIEVVRVGGRILVAGIPDSPEQAHHDHHAESMGVH